MRNAVEAMEQGPRRELSVRVGAAEGMVQVSVVDTGPGVPPEVAAKLFQPFVTTKADGMGIGLSVSCTIIEAHGGRLWMEPNPDGGSLFHLTVPIAPG
jgi:two-component system sensor kinase FixL